MGRRIRIHGVILLTFGIVALLIASPTAIAADFTAANQALENYNGTRDAIQQLRTTEITSLEQQQQQQQQLEQLKAQQREHLELARSAFEAAKVLKANDPKALNQYAELLAADHHYDLAAEALAVAIELDPTKAVQWRTMGQYLGKCGPNKRQAAYDALHRAQRMKSEAMEAIQIHTALAELYLDDKLYEFAEESIAAALTASPNAVYPNVLNACLQLRRGNAVDAETTLASLGKDAAAYDVQVRVLLREIFLDFEANSRWVADTADNHRALSHLYYRAARFNDALMAARQTSLQAPEDVEIHNFAGQILIQLGNYPAALKAFQQSLTVNPGQPNIQRIVQQLQAQQQQPQQQ